MNEAWYEWGHHAPLAKAGGVSQEGIEILGTPEPGNEGGVLSARQWYVCFFVLCLLAFWVWGVGGKNGRGQILTVIQGGGKIYRCYDQDC